MTYFLARIVAVALVLAAVGTAAWADRVTLRNGDTYDGTILEETRTKVVIETTIAGVTIKKSLRKRNVKLIEHGDIASLDANEDDAAKNAADKKVERRAKPANRKAKRKTQDRTMYLEIPIVGTFGEEIQADAVERSLKYAVRQKIQHVVFRIDSGGGHLHAAEKIADAMKAFDDKLEYHAVIEGSAFSATMYLVYSADHVYVAPGASMGAAVAFVMYNTGEIAVDEKLLSAVESKLASLAESKGFSPVIARAMVQPKREVWITRNALGVYAHDADPGNGAKQLDRDDTVLALSREQAADVGLGVVVASADVQALGAHLGIEGWTTAGRYAIAAMAAGARAQKMALGTKDGLFRQFELLLEQVYLDFGEAARNNPSRNRITHYEDGTMTSGSIQEWRESSDRAIQSYERAAIKIRKLERLLTKIQKLGEAVPERINERYRYAAEQIDREVKKLKKNRNKTSI